MSGFVGGYLAEELKQNGYEVCGIDIAGESGNIFCADLNSRNSVYEIVKQIRPDFIFHLAGQANVRASWDIPVETMHTNVDCAVYLLEAMAIYCSKARMLVVGSADEYGVVSPEDCPLREDFPLKPATPYAVSKQAQENMLQCIAYAKHADVIFTRSFNHTGPGQKPGFVVPDFARRIMKIKKTGEAMTVGNLSAQRDFSDVRDVVRAYRLLAEHGKAGEIYNVGSGEAYSMEWILKKMLDIAGIRPKIICDENNFRPVDMPLFLADCSKLRADTGYRTCIPLEQTLSDVLAETAENEID